MRSPNFVPLDATALADPILRRQALKGLPVTEGQASEIRRYGYPGPPRLPWPQDAAAASDLLDNLAGTAAHIRRRRGVEV